jgi:hypothetical protein
LNTGRNIPVYLRLGAVQSNTLLFSYSAPSIGSIQPPTGPATYGVGQEMTITGTSFGSAANPPVSDFARDFA